MQKTPIKGRCAQDRFRIPQTWLKGNKVGERYVQDITKFTLVSHENLSLITPPQSVLTFIKNGKDEYFQIGVNLPASTKERTPYFFIVKFKKNYKNLRIGKKIIEARTFD